MAPSASERHPDMARLPAKSMPAVTLIAFAVGLDVCLANKRIPHTHTHTPSLALYCALNAGQAALLLSLVRNECN